MTHQLKCFAISLIQISVISDNHRGSTSKTFSLNKHFYLISVNLDAQVRECDWIKCVMLHQTIYKENTSNLKYAIPFSN